MKVLERISTGISDAKDYFELIKLCVNAPIREGMDIETMRKKIRILDAFSCEDHEVILEENDFVTVKESVMSMKWPTIHKSLIDFSDYILSL